MITGDTNVDIPQEKKGKKNSKRKRRSMKHLIQTNKKKLYVL